MRMLLVTIWAAVGCGISVAQDTAGEADVEATYEMLRGFMSVERETMIAEELRLSEAERDGFWPLYDEYRAEIEEIQDRYAVLITDYAANYGALSDDLAEHMIDEYFSVKRDTLDVRQDYVDRFTDIMSIQKLARFYQIENRIDNIADMLLMRQIPLTDVPGPVQRGQR
ncbi:MAG: hypothetical protein E2O55_00695 [Gammaproteobacteria bacterium]|nr:MAG: hypothetical protein E2O55_00695 [Gammaproteobacteria bacterium]